MSTAFRGTTRIIKKKRKSQKARMDNKHTREPCKHCIAVERKVSSVGQGLYMMGISNKPPLAFRPSSQVQRRSGEKRPRVEFGLRVHDESRARRNRVERWRLTLGLNLGRRTSWALTCLRLRLPVREEMLLLLRLEVLKMMRERRSRKLVHAVGGVGTGGSAGTELVLLLLLLLLLLSVGSCLRLSFHAGLLMRLCLSLGLGL